MWIGIREDEVMCSSPRAHERVLRMRDGERIGHGISVLEAIVIDGNVVGFGQNVDPKEASALTPRAMEACVSGIEHAFLTHGIRGPVRIHKP